MAVAFGLARAVKSEETDLSSFDVAGFRVSHIHAVRRREQIVQTVGWIK